ncbi:MAG TPA: xanthine phosphoribosyltransferase [Treponema sp.]|nr:xanthine phosphoribosyltransferase [Treponema sp.]
MELLEERIRKDGKVLPGNILKVSSFINHQIDVGLLDELGEEFARRYADRTVTKILTIESSGIAVACATARWFDNCPVVFAKKSSSSNISDDCYRTSVYSYTHSKNYNVIVAKQYLAETDKVLLIDDFLANGSALSGLVDLVGQSGAELAGAGIVIEKGFQEGGEILRKKGYRIESLAIIDSMSAEHGITFRSQNQ